MIKKWFRPDALTVIVAVFATAASRLIGMEIDPANVVAAAIVLLGFFKAQEFVMIVRDANGLPTAFKLNSRKLIFTVLAFALIVADVICNLGLGNEFIFMVAAVITGYNHLEGKKDAKEAEHEAEEARQTH